MRPAGRRHAGVRPPLPAGPTRCRRSPQGTRQRIIDIRAFIRSGSSGGGISSAPR
ncbi:hypothetical protein AvCA_17230 [Azotobacter vinelandii CA]|uniref:Uncharacterized protein n=2 Tax=Azotobacter vinelandii TaxID=354 RepID=C1DSI1_AZOVD|nr:hypothetical protein Avin_17230 [Azotobacter vinelandii DJ]AGK16927.1 hypothetical protein AvCA_17230 [Azotobacter vinelandii CA]AGK20100.1 hypothetical protein AvCA6_17230 [Azotobacter vinelandii CA6]